MCSDGRRAQEAGQQRAEVGEAEEGQPTHGGGQEQEGHGGQEEEAEEDEAPVFGGRELNGRARGKRLPRLKGLRVKVYFNNTSKKR